MHGRYGLNCSVENARCLTASLKDSGQRPTVASPSGKSRTVVISDLRAEAPRSAIARGSRMFQMDWKRFINDRICDSEFQVVGDFASLRAIERRE